MAIDRDKVVQAAQKFAEKKRFDKAIAEYQKIIQEDPNDARTLLKIGDLQLKMEAWQAAIETYERVGKHYAAQGFSLKAIAVYKQIRDIIARHAPQLEERYGHVLPKLAELYQTLGLTSDALAAYDEVAARLLKAGKDKDAIGVFRKIVDLDPSNPLPHLRLAEALARAKETDGAIAEFSAASEILLKLGRRDDALKVVDRLLQIKPDVEVAKRAATLYLDRGQPNDGLLALAKLQTAFQANPKDFDTLGLLARAFEQIDQRPKAVEVQKELARLARDAGDTALFDKTLAYLRRVAPEDDGVKALLRGPKSSLAPPPHKSEPPPKSESVSAAELEVEELESLEDFEIPDSEAPFELSRHSRPAFRPPMRETSSEVDVPESIEAAEDLQEMSGRIDPEAYAQQAIADALAFRHASLPNKALEVLRIALEMVPSSVGLRGELRDVLLDIGDDAGAVGEMVTLAAIAIDAGDFEVALHELYRLLHVMPEHRRAREMLEQLNSIGYGVELEAIPPDATDASPDETNFGLQPDSVRQRMDSFDPEMPLPSYDLEEIGAGDLLSSTSEAPPAPSPPELTETDDPFGEAGGALPTFALDDDPFAGEAHRHEMPTSPGEIDPSTAMPAGARPSSQPADTSMLAGTRGFQGGDSLEDALEEVDFFATRGLYDDARAILDEQLSRAPNHPLLLEKLRELTENQGGGSGARPVPAERTQVTAAGGFDDALDALDALDDAFEPTPEAKEHFHRENEQVDVEAVFAKFKEGVKAQVDDDDSATHYDLGVAYKEMGLIEDAIGEFRTAATDPKKACVCLSMVGVIELERGNLDAAAAAFVEALHAPQRTLDQELSLYYELASIYEAKGNRPEALYYFQKIERKDPDFRDVGERIAALGGERPSATGRSMSKSEDFDSVFDDMVGGGTPAAPRKPPPRRV